MSFWLSRFHPYLCFLLELKSTCTKLKDEIEKQKILHREDFQKIESQKESLEKLKKRCEENNKQVWGVFLWLCANTMQIVEHCEGALKELSDTKDMEIQQLNDRINVCYYSFQLLFASF